MRDKEARSWGEWPVAASPQMGAKETWLGRWALMVSYCPAPPLSSSLFLRQFPSGTHLAKQPNLPSPLPYHVTWLPYKKQPEGNALHFINWHGYPSETIHSIARNFTTVVSDIKWWTVGGQIPQMEKPLQPSLNIICFCFCLPARGDQAAEVEMELGGITIKKKRNCKGSQTRGTWKPGMLGVFIWYP